MFQHARKDHPRRQADVTATFSSFLNACSQWPRSSSDMREIIVALGVAQYADAQCLAIWGDVKCHCIVAYTAAFYMNSSHSFIYVGTIVQSGTELECYMCLFFLSGWDKCRMLGCFPLVQEVFRQKVNAVADLGAYRGSARYCTRSIAMTHASIQFEIDPSLITWT